MYAHGSHLLLALLGRVWHLSTREVRIESFLPADHAAAQRQGNGN